MKLLIFTNLILIVFISNVLPQSENRILDIGLLSVYESWNAVDESDFSEFSNIFTISYYPARNTTTSVSSRYASVGGDVADLTGFSDTQILITQKLPDQNLSLNGGINIPSGKTELNQNEFLTSSIVSQDIFNLRTPNFGQGMNVFLGVTWLHPLSDNFVIGAGISYQIKNEYQPLKEFTSKYKPSNEISVTSGFDIKLNETSTLTGDFTGIFYGSDELDGEKVFSSGNRIISDLLYRKFFGFDYLSILALYRNIAIDELEGIFAVLDKEKINPDQFYLSFSYSQRVSSQVRLEYRLFTSIYERTAAYFSGYKIFGIGINPEFKLSPSLKLPLFLKYSAGIARSKSNLHNFEIGIGIVISL